MKQEASLEKKVSFLFDEDENCEADIKNRSLENSGDGDEDSGAKLSAAQAIMPQKPELLGKPGSRAGSKGAGKVISISKEDIDAELNGPSRSRLMLVMVFVLAGVLGLIVIRSMGFSFFGGGTQAVNDPVSEKVGAGVSDVEIDLEIPESIAGGGGSFSGKGNQAGQSSGIVVRGIIYGNDYKSAIIGKEIVGIGDVVMGAVIVNISRRSVVFRKDGVSWTQYVGK